MSGTAEATAPLPARRRAPGLLPQRTAAASLALQALLLLVAAVSLPALGLRLELRSTLAHLGGISALTALWAFYRFARRRDGAEVIASVAAALVLTLTLSNLLALLQYPAAAWARPLIDPWLARADALLGIHVPDLAAWTGAHPAIARALWLGYYTLLPQFILPFLLLGLVFRDLEALWEFVFHFHFCALVTVTSLALFPAECAFLFYGFESTLEQGRFIAQFQALRAGTMGPLDLRNLEGLISFPSFHVAGAFMVTWCFRRHGWVWPPLAVLNSVLVAATFMSGAHYFVDVLATVAMFAGSIAAQRVWRRARVGRG